MNYFGHASVASWYSSEPGVVLGAMLPDFATMSGARLASPHDVPTVARGVDLHHETDGAFHQLAPVLALMRELDDHLSEAGCARGPRRAAAHIGVELLIDGVLVDEPTYRDAYSAGIAHELDGVRFREADQAPRMAALLDRLRRYGVPDDLKRPDAIVHRLQRMLADRPMLAPSPADLAAIKTALVAHKPRVEVAVGTVLRALRAALEIRVARLAPRAGS